MTVKELMDRLSTMPPDAEINVEWHSIISNVVKNTTDNIEVKEVAGDVYIAVTSI